MKSGQLKPESDYIMERMIAVGVNGPDYQILKKQWLVAADTEWRRIEAISSREQQEQYLAGCETETATSIERIAHEMGIRQTDRH